MKKYNHDKIERKWQKYWADKKIYKTKEGGKKPKCYVLDMFPYLSGEGLHVGHPRGYIATDVYSRFKRMNGFNVLHPMGFDSFGLPAENYAIKNKIHPEIAVKNNVKKFKKQLGLIGFDYDWDREIITSDPNFYKWTQWIFLKMFEKGLAYESYEPINFCPSCLTGLANEDVEDGKCERCGTPVVKKPMRQWVLKITDYAERLLADLNELKDWPEHIKEAQRNWIGKSEGAEVSFQLIANSLQLGEIRIFTTRIDTIFGVTYLVVAPESKIIEELKGQIKNWGEVKKYIDEAKNKSELQRTDLAKDKTGVELKGIKVINPFNNEEVPVWVADYVLGGYGTGAVMAVPSHDERDFEFAKKYELPIKEVIAPYLKDDPKEDKKTEKRDVVVAVVKNSKDNTYLCLNWKTTEWKSFPAGGIEAGEVDLIDAAKREIKEETGYKNIKFIKQIGKSVYAEFYRPHKGSNVFAHFQYLLFDLENEEQTTVSEEEKKNHEIIWVKEKEIESFINVWSQKIIWKRYIQGDFAFCDDGIVTNSGTYTGLKSQEVREKMTKWLEEKKLGGRKINYKLKDWVFSRQRYWGEPIPLIHCENCGVKDIKTKLNLDFHGEHRWNSIIDGKKTIETRALYLPERKNLRVGDLVRLENKTTKQIKIAKIIEVNIFKNLSELSKRGDLIEKIFPDEKISDLKSLEERYEMVDKGYISKINEHGLAAWKLELINAEKIIPVPEKDLPVKLPKVKFYEPTDTGESPLAKMEKWVNVKCPKCGGKGKRETNTMPQWAGSSWYYLAYAMHPSLFQKSKVKSQWSKVLEAGWLPVDMYVGGTEHATRHLIYARFWHKFLYDIGIVGNKEPFASLKNQGLIMGNDGRKMSKRWGNVVNPDEVVGQFGADTLRVYEMFMGPFDQPISWSTDNMVGSRRFLERVYSLSLKIKNKISNLKTENFRPQCQSAAMAGAANLKTENSKLERLLHQTIKKVTEDIENFHFNTTISSLMILLNEIEKNESQLSVVSCQLFIKLLSPFAPHLTEELWANLGGKTSIHLEKWPQYDESKLESDEVTIIVQINGKVRASFKASKNQNQEEIEKIALSLLEVKKWVGDNRIKKILFIKGKVVSIVT